MDKAPDAFRTISEVADHLETPAHVLRFWETRFPQVKPVKGAGGRRYYRPSDVALLSGIRRLLHNDGMTIRGVQKILREQGVRHVAELGGEALETPEPLEALLPQPKPPGEVVALRPAEAAATDELSAIRTALSAMLTPFDDKPEVAPVGPAPGAERGASNAVPSDTGATAFAPEAEDARLTSAALPVEEPSQPEAILVGGLDASASLDDAEALDLAAFDAPLTRDATAPGDPASDGARPEAPAPFAPPLGGIGGFGLDLDVPRGGEGGFIAFADSAEPSRAAPQGFVHPDARPKPKPGGAQPSLFDLMAEEQGLIEEAPEAPHIFVEDEDDDQGAEVSAFPFVPDRPLPEDLPPQEEPAWPMLPEEMPEDMPEALPETLPEEGPGEGPDALPEDWPADLPEDLPEDPAFAADLAGGSGFDDLASADDGAQATEALPARAESPLAPAALAGLAPRLRALSSVDPERLFALADLQARLGLLHAQMAEASARPRRNPGE